MSFLPEAVKFFKNTEISPKEKAILAQELTQRFYAEKVDYNPSHLENCLRFLSHINGTYSLSLNSEAVLSKIDKIFSGKKLSIHDISQILYGLNKCGFSSSFFTPEIRSKILNTLTSQISRNLKSNQNLAEIISVCSSLRSLGLLENSNPSQKGAVKNIIKEVFRKNLEKISLNRKRALLDFTYYCQVVFDANFDYLTNPIAATLPPRDFSPSHTQKLVFKAIREYLETGFSGSKEEWRFMPKKLGASKEHDLAYEVGCLRVYFEKRETLPGSSSDIVIEDRSFYPPRLMIVEVDGSSHGNMIDGVLHKNGGTQARDLMIRKITGQDPLVINYEDFDLFFGRDKAAIKSFLNSIPAINSFREKVLLNPEIKTADSDNAESAPIIANSLPDPDESPLEASAAVDLVDVVSPSVSDKAPLSLVKDFKSSDTTQESKKKKKKKKKKKPQEASSFAAEDEDFVEDISQEDLGLLGILENLGVEEFSNRLVKGKINEDIITIDQSLVDYLLEREDLATLILIRSFSSPNEEIKIRCENQALRFMAEKILDAGTYNFNAEPQEERVTATEMQQRLQKTLFQKRQKEEGELIKSSAKLTQDNQELLKFIYAFHKLDYLGALKLAFSSGNAAYFNFAFTRKGFAEKLSDFTFDIIESGFSVSSSSVKVIAENLLCHKKKPELGDFFYICCKAVLLFGDAQLMQTVIDQKLMCGIEFMQDSKNILLIAQPTHGDFPDVTRCIIEDGGEIFGKCQKFPDGLEFIYGIMENDSVNILRLILEEYAEENFSEKLYELRGERESIYEAALHNKDLVRILLDKPVDLRSEDIVNVFTKGLRNQNYDSLELILQKHQLSLDDFIVSQLMCLREVPEIAKNKQSNVILDKIEASNLRLSRRHLGSTDSGFEEVVSPDSPDLGATTLRDSTKATQLTATQPTNSTGHSVTA